MVVAWRSSAVVWGPRVGGGLGGWWPVVAAAAWARLCVFFFWVCALLLLFLLCCVCGCVFFVGRVSGVWAAASRRARGGGGPPGAGVVACRACCGLRCCGGQGGRWCGARRLGCRCSQRRRRLSAPLVRSRVVAAVRGCVGRHRCRRPGGRARQRARVLSRRRRGRWGCSGVLAGFQSVGRWQNAFDLIS